MSLLERIVAARRKSLAEARAGRARGATAHDAPVSAAGGAGRSGDPGASPGPPEGAAAAPDSSGLRARPGETRPDADLCGLRARPGETARGAGTGRPFEASLRAPGRRIIAEIKRRSPSAGTIRDPLDAAATAASFEEAGAAALSVLTEPDYFGGSDADLVAARRSVRLPVLRKDFILDREGVLETRALGADAVLLIAAVLSPADLADLVRAANEARLEALIEVHDERELESAMRAGAAIIGVNSRDLSDFTVDLARAERLARRIPDGIVRVAESGIQDRSDIARLEGAGYRAFLVGESLLRLPDPARGLEELLG